MDHRRKPVGHRSLVEGDYEAADVRTSAIHAPAPRRSRLNSWAVILLGLVTLLVGIVTVAHFSHVNKLHTESAKGTGGQAVVLRRQDAEVQPQQQQQQQQETQSKEPRQEQQGQEPDLQSHPRRDRRRRREGAGTANAEGQGAGGGDGKAGGAHGAGLSVGDDDDDGSHNDHPADVDSADEDGGHNDHAGDVDSADEDGSHNDHAGDVDSADEDGGDNDSVAVVGDDDDEDGSDADAEASAVGEGDADGGGDTDSVEVVGASDEEDGEGEGVQRAVGEEDPDDGGDAEGEREGDAAVGDDDEEEGGYVYGEASALVDIYLENDSADVAPVVGNVGDNDDDGSHNDHPADVDADEDGGAGSGGDAAADGGAGAGIGGDAAADGSAGAGSSASVVGGGGADAEAEQEPEGSPDYEEDGNTDYNDDGTDQLYVDDVDDDVDGFGDDYSSEEQLEEQTSDMDAVEAADPGVTAAADPKVAAAADPAVTAAASDGCAPLSRELLERWAQNNTVLLTFTNSIMFKNFGATWLHHVRKAGITYWVMAVADNDTAQLVRSRGVEHCFVVHENEIDDTYAAFKWGSRSWQLHTWQKVLTVRHVHQLGFNVINSDMDVVWLRDPLEHFLIKYTTPDYWVSMDPITTRNPIGDDGPELGVSVHHYMNTGVYFLRQTPGGVALINKWYEIRHAMQRAGYHDQDGLYQYLSKNPQDIDFANRVSKVVDGKTALAQLPATLFQNGYSHCINQIHKLHKLQPFEVHFVWVWGGNVGKITRMREQRYFIDPPPYYSDPYFMSFDVLPIEDPAGFNQWNDTEAMVATHLSALDSQLSDTWHGLALAALFNRTMILPKMKCFCIQNWFENPQCRLPGEPHTLFPLTPACPADFIFNMDALASFNLSGARVPFREYSFLDNERTPAAIKDQPLVVRAKLGATAASREGHVVTIPAGLKSDALLAALRPFLEPVSGTAAAGSTKQPKRVHFANPRMAFAGWSDPGVAQEYEANTEGLAVRWCCRPESVAEEHGKELRHQLHLRQAQLPAGAAAGATGTATVAGTALR